MQQVCKVYLIDDAPGKGRYLAKILGVLNSLPGDIVYKDGFSKRLSRAHRDLDLISGAIHDPSGIVLVDAHLPTAEHLAVLDKLRERNASNTVISQRFDVLARALGDPQYLLCAFIALLCRDRQVPFLVHSTVASRKLLDAFERANCPVVHFPYDADSEREIPEIVKSVREVVEKTRGWDRFATILHLSDLHFGAPGSDTVDDQWARFCRFVDEHSFAPDFVAITGDFGWTGSAAETEPALSFLGRLREWLARIRSEKLHAVTRRILLAPGNHESSWVLLDGVANPSEELKKATKQERFLLNDWNPYALAPFLRLWSMFYRDSVFWEPGIGAVVTHDDPAVAFLCVSSCEELSPYGLGAVPYIGARALAKIKEGLEADASTRRARFRVALWHHNLQPFPGSNEYVQLKNADNVIKTCRTGVGVDLVLHGHVHHGHVSAASSGQDVLAYSAVGSFGVHSHHRPGDDDHGRTPNEFSIVELQTRGSSRRFQTQFVRLEPRANEPGHFWNKGQTKVHSLPDPGA